MSIPSSTKYRDDDMMCRAQGLSLSAVALAHPNPLVGAVVAKGGRIVGDGFHTYDNRDHAEIVALRRAGKKARGATMYVSLEPCNHTGRTGPCTEAIIAAGIKRVVVAMRDPNPRVAGRGLARLRRAGIQVEYGLREHVSLKYNEDFAKWIRTGLPFVTLKSALTLDGRISVSARRPTPITGVQTRSNVQKLRHESDAVMTGIGTVLADDPLLTDRTRKPRRKRLLRVVVDSRLRLPLQSQIVKTAAQDVLVFTKASPLSSRALRLARAGVEIVQVPGRSRRVDLRRVMQELGKRQILNVMIEAGSELNGAALEADIVDRAILFYSPKFMGNHGVPIVSMSSRNFLNRSPLQNIKVTAWASYFAVEGYFRDVYGNHRTRRKN
jgi:diaminohydroxyphosphoribosylaminopyrimidine deaminase / 5-amino-6-(5-phosphoribosylamino)uracil reductase